MSTEKNKRQRKASASDRKAVSSGRVRGIRGVAFGALALLLVIAGVWWLAANPRPQLDLHPISRQNVLLVTIDTLRADALGVDGGPAATPALDRLAHEGVRFDFAHAHAVLTLPSHASILTGEYPFQHGVRENSGYRLAPNARTAATLLKHEGYATAAFVAAFPLHSRFGLNQGFDVYDDRFGETREPTAFIMPERPAAEVVPLARTWIASHAAVGSQPSAVGSDPSALNRSKGPSPQAPVPSPWFVWVHVFDPHAPYRPPAPFDGQYPGRPYYGEVAATDAALAPLLDDVRRLAQPTLVVVTGDHGESLGDHGEETHGVFAYESTLHVPLIVAELGGHASSFASLASFAFLTREETGEVSSVAAQHVDILPTLLDAVGATIPPDLPGRSLLAASARRGSSPRASYFEAMSAMLNRGWAPLTGVLVDRDKLIDLPIAERYDLSTDPGETRNLFGQAPERDRTLAASLGAFHAALPGERAAETPEAAAQLRALGYVSGSAPIKARYTEADDPKRLVDIDQGIHNGVDAFSRGNFDEAVRIYQEIIKRRSDMAIAYRHLAFIEWGRGNVSGAIAVLERAVQAGVRHGGVMTQLGSYLTETGHTEEAVPMLESLARAPDADADTLNALGIAYARRGRADDARRVFERVHALTPASSMPLENLGMLDLQRNDLAAARQRFERAVDLDPRSSQAHADLGVVLLKSGDRTTAIAEWTRAVALDATNYDALYNLAMTLLQDGQREAARPYLERFARSAPPAFYAKDIRDVNEILKSRR